MFKLLSYPLTGPSDPVFPGNPPTLFVPKLRISSGDPCNTTELKLYTHNGTHVDAPFHFNPRGRTIDEYEPDELVFSKVVLINCMHRRNPEAIGPEDLMVVRDKGVEAILLYTGSSKLRDTSPEEYVQKAPSLSVEAARFLMTSFPSLRAIVLDVISVESLANAKQNTFPVHKILSGAESAEHGGILIVEDANLEPVLNDMIRRLYIIPLFLKGLDGSPVTVIAEV